MDHAGRRTDAKMPRHRRRMKRIPAMGGRSRSARSLANEAVGAEALIEGVTAAEPAPMAARPLTEDARILSF